MGTQNSGSSVDNGSVKTKRRGLFSKEADEGYVPNRELFAYSAALAGQNLTYQFVTQWLFYFCTDILRIGGNNPLCLHRLGFYIFVSGCCPVGYDVADFAAPSRACKGFAVA